MALVVNTSNSSALLAAIRKAIDDKKIDTWRYDSAGDFTHTASNGQWEEKAWMQPSVVSDLLLFGIVARQDEVMTKATSGVYHGRFAEMLLTHFDGQFAAVSATALLDQKIDVYKAE